MELKNNSFTIRKIIARDEDGSLWLYDKSPYLQNGEFLPKNDQGTFEISSTLCPEVTFKNSPVGWIYVTITLTTDTLNKKNMKKITAFVEKSPDSEYYSVYTEDTDCFKNFGPHGFGDTSKEAEEDFLVALEEGRELLGEEAVPEVIVTFKHVYENS